MASDEGQICRRREGPSDEPPGVRAAAGEDGLLRVVPLPDLALVMWGVVPLSRRVAVSVGGDLLVEALGLAGWRIEAAKWDGMAGVVVLEVVNPEEGEGE